MQAYYRKHKHRMDYAGLKAGDPSLDPAALRGWLGQWFNRDQAYVASIQHALDAR